MLFRKAIRKIEYWFKNSSSALLVDGARQIGKTFLIRHFLKKYCDSFVEFNLIENAQIKQIIETSNDAQEIIARIKLVSGKKLIEGKTVIFFDEVQESKELVTKIKFLVDEGSYKYILSGSLLGVELQDIRSFPVGYLEEITMYPLDFEEFMIANNIDIKVIDYLKKSYENRSSVDPLVHEQIMKLFNLYLFVGGLPQVVNEFINGGNLENVHRVHSAINNLYMKDVGKYDFEHRLLIHDIYALIPSELSNQNKRFILKSMNQKARFYNYEESFVWLNKSNVGLFAYNVDNPVYPLLASKQRTLFKLFYCDIGLLSYNLYSDMVKELFANEIKSNFGAIYESFVAQELKAHGFDLFYFNNKKIGEIDFIIQKGSSIIPLEVKSGKDYKRHSATNNLLKVSDFNINEVIVFNNNHLIETIEVNDKKIVYMPIYLVMFMESKIEFGHIEITLDKEKLNQMFN